MYTDKYRPESPEQIIGESQRKLAKFLISAIENNENIPPQLIEGGSGLGKTTIAKMVRAKLEESGEQVDFIHYNCAEMSGAADARDVAESFYNFPIWGGYKIYIFDEIHRLSPTAQDAFLIPLEEVGDKNNIIIFAATTSLKSVNKAFISRFSVTKFNPPSRGEMILLIKAISRRESIAIDDRAMEELIQVSGGNIRNLVTNLEQYGNDNFNFTVDDRADENQIKLLKSRDLSALLKLEDDYSSILYRFCYYAMKVLENKPNDKWALSVMSEIGNPLISLSSIDKLAYGVIISNFCYNDF